jgi:hypothetical protein
MAYVMADSEDQKETPEAGGYDAEDRKEGPEISLTSIKVLPFNACPGCNYTYKD